MQSEVEACGSVGARHTCTAGLRVHETFPDARQSCLAHQKCLSSREPHPREPLNVFGASQPFGSILLCTHFFTSYHVVNDQQANQTAARAIRARVRQRTSFSFSGYIRHITFSKPSLLSRAPSPHIERGCALGKIATRSGCHLRMPLVEPIDSEFTRWILAHAPVKR